MLCPFEKVKGVQAIRTYREKPMELKYLDVLVRRAIAEEKVKQEWRMKLAQLKAGYFGERRVDNEWREVNIQGGVLLHDFTCRNSAGNTHQIDSVFICKHFILVIEIKNVGGRIDFDDKRRQFLRTTEDGRVESFNNPIDQVKRHRDLFIEASLDWPFYVPVEAFVVIANPYTVIGRVSNEVPVFNVSGLRTKIGELMKKHAAVNVNVRMLRSFVEQMYEPVKRQFTCDFPIRSGALCLQCNEVLQHVSRGFKCPRCGWRDLTGVALRNAMLDYRILYGDRITNHAFREFVGVSNIYTANHMLNKLFTGTEGKNKGRKYIIPPNIEKEV